MPTKLLRPNVGIYIATADAFANADITASGWQPTLAQVSDIAKVFNISPAVTDAYTLNLTDSDSDNSLSIVDNAQVSVPTTYNYEVSLDGFRDSASAADSYFNKFKALLADAAVGTKYYIIKRTAKAHNAAFALGDNISVFGVTTDYADDLVADGEMIRVGGRFIQTGEVAVNTTVAAGTLGTGPWGTVTDTTARPTGTKIQSNGNVAVWWVPAAAVTNEATFITAPTAAIINGATVVNLTEAIAWDGYTLGATESNKIDDKGIIDRTNSKVRGFAQFSGALTFFRPRFPTVSLAATGTSATSVVTLTTPADSAKVEVGMKLTATGIGTGAVITAINTSTGALTVSVPNSAAVAGPVVFTSSYSLAFDTFKAATNARPNGWLVTRVGKNAASALIATDVVSVFKFTADAVMDDTEGEDSMKFMVNYMPAGLIGVNLTVA
jgi:hypothetical protein